MTGLGNMDDVYKHYLKVIEENKQLKAKLDISVKALEFYAIPLSQLSPVYNIAQHHKKAAEALARIKELDK